MGENGTRSHSDDIRIQLHRFCAKFQTLSCYVETLMKIHLFSSHLSSTFFIFNLCVSFYLEEVHLWNSKPGVGFFFYCGVTVLCQRRSLGSSRRENAGKGKIRRFFPEYFVDSSPFVTGYTSQVGVELRPALRRWLRQRTGFLGNFRLDVFVHRNTGDWQGDDQSETSSSLKVGQRTTNSSA